MTATLTRPETPNEARHFTIRRNTYALMGLCDVCAAQASYAHAHGASLVEPPCPDCTHTVASFPNPKGNGWNLLKTTRKTNRNEPSRSTADLSGVLTLPVAAVDLAGPPAAREGVE